MADPRGVEILNKVNEIPYKRGTVTNIADYVAQADYLARQREREKKEQAQHLAEHEVKGPVNGYGGALGAAVQAQGLGNAHPDQANDAGTAPAPLSDRLQSLHAALQHHVSKSDWHHGKAHAIASAIQVLTDHPEYEPLIDAIRQGIV